MRPSVLNKFPIACCLMSLVLNGAGEFLILQEPEKYDGIRYPCISEDDGTALVWNHELKYYGRKQHVLEEFRSIRVRNMTKCALVESKNCTAYWKKSVDWNIVNSRDYPMGPVFDSRWEDFAETSFREANQDHKNYQYVMKMTKSSDVVFSVRGPQIISIRICEKNNSEDGSCTTITLGKSDNYCTFTNFGSPYEKACINTDQTAESEKNLLSKQLWRTVILQWDVQSITVCNEFRCSFGILLKHGIGSRDKYFFLNMVDEGLVRFHFYDYLLATRKDSTLESDKFYNDEQNLCFEFIAGICNNCYLEIYVVDVKGISQRLKIIYPVHFSGINGMLTWQRVILNETLKHDYKGQLSLKIKSGFDYEPYVKLRWAISTFRKCKSVDAGRELSFIKLMWQIPSEVREVHHCQKISYDPTESFAVSSYFTTASRNISASMQEYLRRTSSKQAPCPSNWWERTSICGESGCVCIEKTSNIGTTGNEKLEVKQTETSIELELPAIVNEKLDREVVIVVKGSSTCPSKKLSNDLRKRINMTESEKGWIAATFPVDQPSSKVIIPIEQRPAAKNTSNDCFLRPGETYVIVVVVVTKKDIASVFKASLPIKIAVKKNTENSVSGWMISFFILAISSLLLFIWRRKILGVTKRIFCQDSIKYKQMLANFVESTITLISGESVAPMEETTDDALSITAHIYEEIISNRSSSLKSFKDFENYVKESTGSRFLQIQFKMFQKGLIRPYVYGLLPENRPKNRYPNIIPYDDTRVILRRISGDPHSDYINANYVQGYRKKNAYIATQNPIHRTIEDFWRMIWETDATIICMLADVTDDQKKKFVQYWPQLGASEQYGNIVVVTGNQQLFADYTLRTFRVDHLYYTGWPSHSVPVYTHSVISCLGKLLAMPIGKGPIVVHSDAGVGRTGAFILCDICLRRAIATGEIDVVAELRKLRDSRPNMVQNELQYVFAHIVLVEWLVTLPTKLVCDNGLPQRIKLLKEQLPEHIQRLRDSEWQNQALRFDLMTTKPPNPKRNEEDGDPEKALASTSLAYSPMYLIYNDNSNPINAVIVDGLRVKRQYLTCQLPQSSNLYDFWRLVAEQEVRQIIVLQQPDPNDPMCRRIITDENPFTSVPFMNVEIKTSKNNEDCFITDELTLTETLEGIASRSRQISVLTCTEWGIGEGGKPPPPKNLVNFWIASQNIRRKEGPTLVLCHNGVSGCGLYLALSFILERMAVERECDIILAVRAIRRSRPDFVQSQEQFEYLYDAAAEYIKSFNTYANFA